MMNESSLTSGKPKSSGYSAIITENNAMGENGNVVELPYRSSRLVERVVFFIAGILFAVLFSSFNQNYGWFPTNTFDRDIAKELAEEKVIVAEEEAAVIEEKSEIDVDVVELARLKNILARERTERCRGVTWLEACERIGDAGARRNKRRLDNNANVSNVEYTILEEALLDSDNPSVMFDQNCLRLYRLKMENKVTFPYHASQLLRGGGNETMALFIQHGAMRDADHYFCSFAKLMTEQQYRPFQDIVVIAPNFEYQGDSKVYPYDAFWNSTKPWGDWKVGAESDPECCGNKKGAEEPITLSSFDIIDHMLALLTDRELYPNMNKISILGHSAGGQMVQRYAIMSLLAAAYDEEDFNEIDVQFVVANPSSYTYLDKRRFSYNCGHCSCSDDNCTCPELCTNKNEELSIPSRHGVGKGEWPCFSSRYNDWPYGIQNTYDPRHMVEYVKKSNPLRASHSYYRRNITYLVGQNDTCNDGLPVCDESCWKRTDYSEDEWPCYRNHMDSRCPAMLQGPFRRLRGHRYMRYLESYYGKPTHRLYEVPGVGHNATGMFGSELGLKVIFS